MTLSNPDNGHQKHVKLVKPSLGNYGRNEIALMGTPCGKIKQLAWKMIESLSELKVAFVDADHKAADMEVEGALHHGATLGFTDKISFRRFDYAVNPNTYQIKKYFNSCDAIVVNGNHFIASYQILIIDPKKPLERKLERITHPVLVILSPEVTEIPDYLREITREVPVMNWDNESGIIDFIKEWVNTRLPKLKGLVLAGGKSQRMEQDKGALQYHGNTQRQHVYQQLESVGIPSWISCRPDQLKNIEHELPKLPDSYLDLGPLGALLTAFRSDPDSAWLSVACDLPYLQTTTLQYLLDQRDCSKIATAFQSPFDEFPEPLITIWEPKSYLILMQFLNQGYSCPRKVLINSDIALIDPPDPRELTNINHPHEYKEALRDLKQKH